MCTNLSSASAQAASLRPGLLVPPTWFKSLPKAFKWVNVTSATGTRVSFQLHFSSSALEHPALRFHTYSHDFSLPIPSPPPGSSLRVLPCVAPTSLEDASNVSEGLTLPMDGETVMDWGSDF